MNLPGGRARLPGLVAFALVWVVGGAVLLDDGSDVAVSPTSFDPYPPGTFSEAPAPEQICGDYEADPNQNLELTQHRGELTCLLEAFDDGRPAVLVRRAIDVEGMPTRTQVRVHGTVDLEILIDRPDTDGVRRLVCTGVDRTTFRPTGCDDAPPP